MKKILIVIATLLVSLASSAQMDKYTVSSRGISQTKTFECPNMTAGQIYSKVVEYIDQAYVESNQVTKSADNINNQIIASGYYKTDLTTKKVTDWGIPNTFPTGLLPIDIHHHLKVKCEDGKASVKISIDYYTLCRQPKYAECGCYNMNIAVLKVNPFGQYTTEDHSKAKLINKAMSNEAIFPTLDAMVDNEFKELQEFILQDDF